MLSIGLMSGTSMDGIDAALLETEGSAHQIQDLGLSSISYDSNTKILLKAAEYAVRRHIGTMDKAEADYSQALQAYLITELKLSVGQAAQTQAELSTYLNGSKSKLLSLDAVIQHSTELHLKAIKKLLHETGHKASQIDVIGYHGQTLLHRPALKTSIVVGKGQYLADQLGITVVNDFRSRDVAAGGEGAPFAPLYHQALALRDNKIPLAVVNCGGIANLSLIQSAEEHSLIGFDTGPGNGLIDRFIRQRTQGKEQMDVDGQYGQKGQVRESILNALYERAIQQDGQNYFLKKPPKSLDIGDMELIPELNALSIEDGCANLEAFTADSIMKSLELLNCDIPKNWILVGGGWQNPVIYRELEQRLNKKLNYSLQLLSAEEAGWSSQAIEAQTFAYLAIRALQNKPLSLPGTTRVPKPLSGGQIHLPKSGPTKAVAALIKQGQKSAVFLG